MLFHQSMVGLPEYTFREKWHCLLQQWTTTLCLMGVCLGGGGMGGGRGTASPSPFSIVAWAYMGFACSHDCCGLICVAVLLFPDVSLESPTSLPLSSSYLWARGGGVWQCVPPGLNCVWLWFCTPSLFHVCLSQPTLSLPLIGSQHFNFSLAVCKQPLFSGNRIVPINYALLCICQLAV